MKKQEPFEKNSILWKEKHSSFGLAIEEQEDSFLSLATTTFKETFPSSIEEVDVLFIYGIPNEEFLGQGISWLAKYPKKFLVVIEDDKNAFFRFLQTEQALLFLNEPHGYLFFEKELNSLNEAVQKFAWQTLFLSSEFFSCQHKEPLLTSKLKEMVDHIQNGVFLIGSDYSDFGLRCFSNTFANLYQQQEIYPLQNLEGCFTKIPAIICGGGPSLDKVLPLLKTVQDRAIVFAGGSALGALAQKEITPHFGASVDKRASLDRFESAHLVDIPYLYQLSSSQEIFSKIKNKKNILVGGYGAYPLEGVIAKELHLEQKPLSYGWTVTTLLMQAAYFMGCDPIILVGLDLSFSGNSDYALGVKSQAHENPKRIEKDKNLYTQKDWMMAQSWVEEIVKATSATQWINCSQGQWKEPFASQDFAAVCKKHLSLPQNISEMVNQTLDRMKAHSVKNEEIEELQQKIRRSFASAQALIGERLQQMESFLFSSNLEALNEHTVLLLEQELIVKALLAPLWNIFHSLIERNAESMEETLPKEIHQEMVKILFYQQVIHEYAESLGSNNARKI